MCTIVRRLAGLGASTARAVLPFSGIPEGLWRCFFGLLLCFGIDTASLLACVCDLLIDRQQ